MIVFLNYYKKSKEIYLWLFVVLALFEFFEAFLYYNLTDLFMMETFCNAIWDIIFGMMGGVIVGWLYDKY